MTICVGIKVHDCIVFAADSASTIGSGDNCQVYNNANKVFNLHRKLPICAMTCGLGNFGNETISTMSKDLRKAFETDANMHLDPGNYTLEEVTEKSAKFFKDKYDNLMDPKNGEHVMEYFIGGYSSEGNKNELWKIVLVGGEIVLQTMLSGPDEPNIIWGGQPEAIERLIMGHPMNLADIFKNAGLEDDAADGLVDIVKSNSVAPVLKAVMPVIDAIDLAKFLVDTTAKFIKFLPGANTVGGDADIATVTKHEGFKWIERKHYYPAHLNRENSHA